MTKRYLHSGTYTLGLVASISVATALSGASCSSEPTNPNNTSSASASSSGMAGAGGEGGGTASSSSSGVGGSGGGVATCPCSDFPKDPVLLDGLTDEVAKAFAMAPPGATGSICISEPSNDAMVPKNWSPLFVEYSATVGHNVFEIKLEVDNQINPLLVYTSKKEYMMTLNLWKSLTYSSAGHDVKITVRSAKWNGTVFTGGPDISETTMLHIAPIDAPGSVVYSSIVPGTADTFFRGFTVGDTETRLVLDKVKAGVNAGGKPTGCFSCHTSSPDGKVIFYSSDDVPAKYRSVDVRLVADATKRPGTDIVSDAAYALLGRHRQLAPVLSPAHFNKPGDSVVITTYVVDPSNKSNLIWTDLQATDMNGWGTIARNGDPRNPTSATWSHDGKDIAYVSSAGGHEGVIAEIIPNDATMDIYVVPYNNRMGGDAKPLPGASDPAKREFYPIYSPDDTFIAFNRSDIAQKSYDQPTAEVFLIPREGGVPRRLTSNDPPMCTGSKSPGITNSWARWAPLAQSHEGLRYYWLVFSSKRRVAAGLRPQLYIAAIVTKLENNVEVVVADYPAVLVAPQLPTENNHTPVWDYFVVNEIPK